MKALNVALLLVTLLSFATTVNAAPVTIDTTTEGNWVGHYGNYGYILNAFDADVDRVSLPSFVSGYSTSGTSQDVWATNTAPDTRALQDPSSLSTYNAATTYNNGSFTYTLNLSSPKDFNLSVYALDWDSTTRDIKIQVGSQTVEVNNVGVNSTPLDAYHNGEWVTFHLIEPAGSLPINITEIGSPNATISAITFSTYTPEPSSFILCGLGVVGLFIVARRRKA